MIGTTTRRGARGRRATSRNLRARSRRVRREASGPDSHSERVRLITFMWTGRTGEQPVIFADRTWLQ